MSEEIEQAPERIVSERGRKTIHTEDEVNLALKLLILSGGSYKPAVEQLEEQGITNIQREKLRNWRDNAFPRRYWQIRQELGRDVSEEVAGRAMETALKADHATNLYIEEAVAKLSRVPPAHLAKSAQALYSVLDKAVEKAQLLRDKPTEIREVKAADELIAELERLGVAERSTVIDAEVVEEEDL